MRSKTIFGALLVSVALCSQGFGFELLDRMLGLNGGCGDNKACAKVATCDPCAKVAACDPCAKACCPEPACCDPACCDPCCGQKCHNCCRITPVRDLFGGLKDLFECKGTYCEPVCAPACDPACNQACEAACDPCCDPCKVKKCRTPRRCKKSCCDTCCTPACDPACEKVAACDPTCEPTCKPKCHKLYRRPVVELLEALFGGLRRGTPDARTG